RGRLICVRSGRSLGRDEPSSRDATGRARAPQRRARGPAQRGGGAPGGAGSGGARGARGVAVGALRGHRGGGRPGRGGRGGGLALVAALAFGLTTPLVQRFGEGVGPFSTGALLYAGAALATVGRARGIRAAHLPRLAIVAACGGVIAPACLAWGLQRTSAV